MLNLATYSKLSVKMKHCHTNLYEDEAIAKTFTNIRLGECTSLSALNNMPKRAILDPDICNYQNKWIINIGNSRFCKTTMWKSMLQLKILRMQYQKTQSFAKQFHPFLWFCINSKKMSNRLYVIYSWNLSSMVQIYQSSIADGNVRYKNKN